VTPGERCSYMLYYNRIRVTEQLLAFTKHSYLKAQTERVNKETSNASQQS